MSIKSRSFFREH